MPQFMPSVLRRDPTKAERQKNITVKTKVKHEKLYRQLYYRYTQHTHIAAKQAVERHFNWCGML